MKYLWQCFCTAVLLCAASFGTAATAPNVLVIVVDDMGFTDLGSFGGEIDTPNLDQLAYGGIRFSNFHAMPTCSPTRAALLSGIDPHLAGLGSMAEELSPNQKGQPGYEGYLNDSVVSVATLLRDAGYRTYLSGKWHLGDTPDNGPQSQGFQRAFSLLSGGASHFPDMLPAYHPDPNAKAVYVEDGKRLATLPDDFHYSTQFYADKLLAYLRADAKSEQPFFAMLTYTAPHWPLQVPSGAMIEKYIGRYSEGYDVLYKQRLASARKQGLLPTAPEAARSLKAPPWEQLSDEQKRWQIRAMAIYAAMIDQVDVHTGKVIDYLRTSGKLDDTLVLFLSDNGPEGHDLDETWPAELFPKIRKTINARHDFSYANMGLPRSYTLYGGGWARASSAGLRLYKGFPSEGGTRVAAFASYPAKMKGERLVDDLISVRDLAPTILAVAGVAAPKGQYGDRKVHTMRGSSFLPLLQGVNGRTQADLGIELFGKYALRSGDWKLLVMPPPYASSEAELYNIVKDPGETENLASSEPQRLAAMQAKWQQYQRDNNVILPDWVSGY